MLFIGNPILPKAPRLCESHQGDCPVHGYGLPEDRAELISKAIAEHTLSCRDLQAGTADFISLVAGPADLDLLSPSEVLYAGALIGYYHADITAWLATTGPASNLPPGIQQIVDLARANGFGVQVTKVKEDDLDQDVRDYLQKFKDKFNGPQPGQPDNE